jgi:uncharacterized membrane protein
MVYFALKYLHLIGAAVLIGTGAGIAFFMLMAHRTGEAVQIAAVARIAVVADFLFTATAVVAQPITGIALAWHVGYSLTDGWIALSILLYIVTVAFGFPSFGCRCACGTWRKPRRAKAYCFHRRITACSGPGSRSAFPRLRPSSASCG